MATHTASGQMVGYLYQVVAALVLLLKSEDGLSEICIEKFDDISFVDNGKPMELIQVKHQLNKVGSLTDTSVDLWRSINSWCDAIKQNDVNCENTKFVILTTAIAPEDSAARKLTDKTGRNVTEALEQLRDIAKTCDVKTIKKFCLNFESLDSEKQELLITNAYCYDHQCHISEYKREIKQSLKYTTLPEYEDFICDQLIGWWMDKAIQFLCSDELVHITQHQLRTKLYEISSMYREDSLPITVDWDIYPTEEEMETLDNETRIFIEQLKLISLSSKRMKRAIRDYYNAFQQRSKWMREDLLYVDELENYEKRLIDEWDRLFEISKEELEDDGIDSEERKKDAGKKLYNNIENLDLRIRNGVTEPFVMRGTFHGLANKLSVGWHIDFYERLHHLLGE